MMEETIMMKKTLTDAQHAWFKNEKECQDLNSWCIIVQTSHQYAAGITGLDIHTYVYIQDNGNGYPYAAAAYKAAKEYGIKNTHRKGKPAPYGNIGEYDEVRKAIQIKDIPKYW